MKVRWAFMSTFTPRHCSAAPTLPPLVERFFTERLMCQRRASSHTVASYRDTYRQLLAFTQEQLGKTPSSDNLEDIDATLIGTFLDGLKTGLAAGIRTRDLRLSAVRSFSRPVAYEEPAHSALIQRVLAIRSKPHVEARVHFVVRFEIEALLSGPDRSR